MDIKTAVAYALSEDVSHIGDITVNTLIPETATTSARIFAKADGIISGVDYITETFAHMQTLYPNKNPVNVTIITPNGTPVKYGDTIATLTGASTHIITGERTALNFVGFLSGVATTTAQAVAIATPYNTIVACTRKTIPIYRQAQKDAVIHGGGHPHRMGLYDAVMIKDNHLLAVCDIVNASMVVKTKNSHVKITVEVDTLEQLEHVLPTQPHTILLDNMPPDTIRRAIAIRNAIHPNVMLEASGNITLDTLQDYCKTGVDMISMGWLTHSTKTLDISLELL